MSNLVNGNVVTGVATGEATSTSVTVGFEPSSVEVFNETTNMEYELTNGASNIKITTGSTGAVTMSAASAGVSLSMLKNGFKVKSSAADKLVYKAIR